MAGDEDQRELRLRRLVLSLVTRQRRLTAYNACTTEIAPNRSEVVTGLLTYKVRRLALDGQRNGEASLPLGPGQGCPASGGDRRVAGGNGADRPRAERHGAFPFASHRSRPYERLETSQTRVPDHLRRPTALPECHPAPRAAHPSPGRGRRWAVPMQVRAGGGGVPCAMKSRSTGPLA